MSIVINQ